MAHMLSLRSKGGIVSSNDPTLTLVDGLAVTTLTNMAIVEFLKNQLLFPLRNNIIWPVSCRQAGDKWSFVYRPYGKAIRQLSQQDVREIVTDEFIRDFSLLYCQLSQLRPVISQNNVFVREKQPLKILQTTCYQNAQEYMGAYHSFIKRVASHNKSTIQRIKDVNDISFIKEIFTPPKQGKPLSKILQLKFNVKLQPYKIRMEEADLQWIFSSFGLKDPKYELVYSGAQHNFDPTPLLKAISKLNVFFLIENTKGSRVAFYASVKYQVSSGLFGGYLADKQKKAVMLGLERRSVHPLQEQQFAVGYGGQVLLAIGKVDMVLSAYNASNISYFPISYRSDEKAGVVSADDLLGSQFTLRQLEAYKIL